MASYHITSPSFEPLLCDTDKSVFANKDGFKCPCVVLFAMSRKGKETYTTFSKLGSVRFIFIQQECIKLIKRDNKDL